MASKHKRHSRRSAGSRQRKSSPNFLMRWVVVLLPIVILVIAVTTIRKSSPAQTVLGVATSAFRAETVKWNSVEGAAGYNIYYKEESDKDYANAVRNIPAFSTSYTINYLKKNTDYQYIIKAFDSSEKEFWSSSRKWIWAVK